ncbi:hypothetical protein [Hyalangium versicolor]|uniref:hypothetical protein n=1 Tax=Hyalangium versicolor TaxID=2861190 RepID=UPI001CCE1D4C|nr:hypothetical protein [Hyalangium versicolor]
MSRRILPGLALAGLLTACGDGPYLEGSISPLLDLHYELAKATATTGEVSVNFVTTQKCGENTVSENTLLSVSAQLEKLQVAPSVEINLAELLGEGEDAPQRGRVRRRVLNEPERDFPRILIGGLTLDKSLEALTPGTKVTGDFHVTFVNGTDVYSGRTVFGHFNATVPEPQPDPLPTTEECP